MVFKNPYWTNVTKIQLLQRWILVHSVLYYEYDTTLVEDRVYDMNEVQLAKMMKKYPKSAAQTQFAYAFKGFDGSTGFDLFSKLKKKDKKEITQIIEFILKTEGKRL